MGNARGNVYSKAHVTYNIDSPAFWNFRYLPNIPTFPNFINILMFTFSWHEMGVYDLPAALYYVSNMTQSPGEIIYIGHSMGTTMFFVLSSVRPQVAKNVKVMVALAPVAYMTHIRSPIKYLAPFVFDFQVSTNNHLRVFNYTDFFSSGSLST